MKKLFTLIACVFMVQVASAQLNGTYTIGGTSPDYSTISAAVMDLQVNGVSGPCVFNIRQGIYDEKVQISAISGTSATNTVTFKSENNDSLTVLIRDSAAFSSTDNFTVNINGADYINFHQVTIQRAGALLNSTVILIGPNSSNVSFTNCFITAEFPGNGLIPKSTVYMPSGSSADANLTFANNVIYGGSYGLYLEGSNGNSIPSPQIINNVFQNQYNTAIRCRFASAPVIRGNQITTISTSTVYNGINLVRVSGQASVTLNKVSGISSGGNCLLIDSCTASLGSEALIANNFFAAEGSGPSRGIRIRFSDYVHIYHNSINITTNMAAAAGIYLEDAGSFISIMNNIIVNTGGGWIYYVEGSAISSIFICAYNNLYVAPGDIEFAFVDSFSVADLTAWRSATGKDQNSVSVDPMFTSPTDLHAASPGINGIGTPVASVTTDIDGQPRDSSAPDIGADEISPLADDIGVIGLFMPADGDCGDSATVVGIIIQNFGLNAQTGFQLTADFSGALTGTLNETYPATLNANQVDTFYFTQTFNSYAGGNVVFTAYHDLSADQYLPNDTLIVSFAFTPHPNSPSVISPQVQCDNTVALTATPDPGDVLFWYDQPSGGNLLFAGDTFSPSVSSDTAFYVESRRGRGTAGCLRITEIGTDSTDYIEIQNMSADTVDASGWLIRISDSYADINDVNSISWPLGVFAPGEVQYRTDDSQDNPWGNNIFWDDNNPGWAMLIDLQRNIQDFVAWEWDSAEVQTLVVNVAGTFITVGEEWTGNTITTCNTGDALSRKGSSDQNQASDFACEPPSKGVANANLAGIFSTCNTGECGSPRVRVDVTVLPGVTVNLGNDIFIDAPFSIDLDAGSGFSSYLWSTGDLTQTITVTAHGTYWVTVTGMNGCTFTDSIVIDMPVGIAENFSDVIRLYPVPASNLLMIEGAGADIHELRITVRDMSGRVAGGIFNSETDGKLDISKLAEGVYILEGVMGERKFTTRVVVVN